jgi:hypothetical protein
VGGRSKDGTFDQHAGHWTKMHRMLQDVPRISFRNTHIGIINRKEYIEKV